MDVPSSGAATMTSAAHPCRHEPLKFLRIAIPLVVLIS
jgi:hypothetical protein